MIPELCGLGAKVVESGDFAVAGCPSHGNTAASLWLLFD
jgi:hypothetical protein